MPDKSDTTPIMIPAQTGFTKWKNLWFGKDGQTCIFNTVFNSEQEAKIAADTILGLPDKPDYISHAMQIPVKS